LKIIRAEDNNYAVVAGIRVAGPVVWNYEYVVDDYTISRKGDDDGTRRFALGMPEELGGDSSAWIFTIFNPGKKDAKFDASIRWDQGDRKITTWSGRGTVKPGRVVRKSGEALFVVRKDDGS
jgi:hypothetical protein